MTADKGAAVAEWISYIGGFTLALCLLPQIYKSLSTGKTEDISFFYQFMYVIGLSIQLPYVYYLDLYAIAIPLSAELCCIITAILIKFKFDVLDKKCLNKTIETESEPKKSTTGAYATDAEEPHVTV